MEFEIVVGILAGVAALVVIIGGFVGGVGGGWRDGERFVKLEQTGPFVKGRAELAGGYETYDGWALFGRVRLNRRAHGIALLLRLGFPQEIVTNLEGTQTARLLFRLDGERLAGKFVGRRFHFEGTPPVLVDSGEELPLDREWTRG